MTKKDYVMLADAVRKARWYIADLDHGTRRVQISPVTTCAGVLS